MKKTLLISFYTLATFLLLWHNMMPHQHQKDLTPVLEAQAENPWYSVLQNVLGLDIGQSHLEDVQTSKLQNTAELAVNLDLNLHCQPSGLALQATVFLTSLPTIYRSLHYPNPHLSTCALLRAPPLNN